MDYCTSSNNTLFKSTMITSIDVKNFMSHASLKHADLPMINVLIGKNDAGKTGLLKLLYASIKALEVYD